MVKGAEWQESTTNQFMVECCHKRTRFSQASSAQEEMNYIHILQDELLLEILCRLPCSKSVVQCICVCRRWAALISDPYFISRFIASKVEGHVPCIEVGDATFNNIRSGSHQESNASCFGRTEIEMKTKESSFSVVARRDRSRLSQETWKGFTMNLKDPNANLRDFSFSDLSSMVKNGDATDLTVVGACHDLLLYWVQRFGRHDYYICSMQTKQWLQLPSPPYYEKHVLIGFMCDPY